LFICASNNGSSAELGFTKGTFIRRCQANRRRRGCEHESLSISCFAALAVKCEQIDEKMDALSRPQSAPELGPDRGKKFLDFIFRGFRNCLTEPIRIWVEGSLVTCNQSVGGGARNSTLSQEARPLTVAAGFASMRSATASAVTLKHPERSCH